MKYQHQSKEYKADTKGFTGYLNALPKKNLHTQKAKNEQVHKSVAFEYFKNKARSWFIARMYVEKNWITKNILKQIIMLPPRLEFAFSTIKCKVGIHFHTKQQLVNAGIRPPKQRAKYYKHCFICGKAVRGA